MFFHGVAHQIILCLECNFLSLIAYCYTHMSTCSLILLGVYMVVLAVLGLWVGRLAWKWMICSSVHMRHRNVMMRPASYFTKLCWKWFTLFPNAPVCGYLVILMDMLDLMCGVLPLDLKGVMLLQIRMDLHLFEHVKLPVCYLLTHIAVEVTPGGPLMAKRVIALTILPPDRCMQGQQSPWQAVANVAWPGPLASRSWSFCPTAMGPFTHFSATSALE